MGQILSGLCLLFQLLDMILAFNRSCQVTIFKKSDENTNFKFLGI